MTAYALSADLMTGTGQTPQCGSAGHSNITGKKYREVEMTRSNVVQLRPHDSALDPLAVRRRRLHERSDALIGASRALMGTMGDFSSSQLGPVRLPVVRPKLTAVNTGHALDGCAAVCGDASRPPVRDGLKGFPKGLGESGHAPCEANCTVSGSLRFHPTSVNDSFTRGQHLVSTHIHTACMDGKQVLARVNEELAYRKGRGLTPSSWAQIGEVLGLTRQVRYNWGKRGIPAEEYPRVAGALDWSVDQLLGAEPVETPPRPSPNSIEARVLEALRLLAPNEQLEVIEDILGRADRSQRQRPAREEEAQPLQLRAPARTKGER